MKVVLGKKKSVNESKSTTAQNNVAKQKIELHKTVVQREGMSGEIIKKRGIRSKFFGNGNNIVAEFYGEPVHYKAGSGELLEIDNTLVEHDGYYETTANSFKTRFMKRAADGTIFELKGKHGKVRLMGRGELQNCKAVPVASLPQKNTVKTPGVIKYNNVLPDVDFEYRVSATRVKENIVIRKKAEKYEYDFKLAIDDLTVGLSVDGKTLELRSKATGNPQFLIPAPYMIDAKGVRSESVYYEIIQESDDLLKLKVIADAEWINDEKRAMPVTIDPQINVWEPDQSEYCGYYGAYMTGAYGYYADDYADSVFRYESYSTVGSRGYQMYMDIRGDWCGNDLKVYCYFDDSGEEVHVDCKLIIAKDRIPAGILKNLINAKVILRVSEDSYGSDMAIDGMFCQVMPGETYEVDVTDRLMSDDSTPYIPLVDIHDRGGCGDKNIVFEPPVLELVFADHVVELNVKTEPVKTDYISGEKFDSTGMMLSATYWSGIAQNVLPDMCEMKPGEKETLTTYDKYITFTYEDVSAKYFIGMPDKGFNDRKPEEGRENRYKIVFADGNEIRYATIELDDGVNDDLKRMGTPLNAENLNKNLIINAANIYGTISEENLPDYLKSANISSKLK